MRDIKWDLLKNQELKKTRGVSFDEIIRERLIGVMKHPRKTHQNIMLFERRGYVWVVPYVVRGDEIFLKTLFASRKYTRIFKQGGNVK